MKSAKGCGTNTYVFLRIVPHGRRIVRFRHITRCAADAPDGPQRTLESRFVRVTPPFAADD
jgi:hypothetical protein